MKTMKLLALVLVLVLLVSNSYAQRRNQVELYGGLAFPMAPEGFKDWFKMGYSVNAQYVMFPTPNIGVSFGAAFEPFAVDEDAFVENVLGASKSDLEDQGIEVEIDMGLNILELCLGVRPYITSPEANTQIFLFGMGTYNLMKTTAKYKVKGTYYDPYSGQYYTDEQSGDASEDINKVGAAVGAGFELPAGESMNLIFQGVYRFIFTEDETTSFLGVTAGLIF